MRLSYPALFAAVGVNAFPNLMVEHFEPRAAAQGGCSVSKLCDTRVDISDAQAHIPASPNAATKASAARSNCGVGHVCSTFNAKDQYVSTTGQYAYQSPGATDIRGPCPGLNAAANHGYLPRNGLATITQTVTGLGALYNMAPDLSAFLAAYAIAFDGDLTTQQWSIGGPIPPNILSGLLGPAEGISYSHNNYEGDSSIARCDAYTNGGDAHSLSLTRYKYAYETGLDNGLYTLDKFSRDFAKNTHRSEQQNPYYFTGLFSTTLVAPAAYNFIINFMSNHSAQNPGGYLDGKQLNQFFGISGTYPNFKWNKGQERIPDNWYRRPSSQQYSATDVFKDLIVEFAAYPDTFRFGGNVNGVNTYTGIDISNLTGGTYNAQTLLQGNNFGCFLFQSFQQLFPQQLKGGVNDAAAAFALIAANWPAAFTSLSCKPLAKYDTSVFQKYPGSGYKPTGPTTGPQNC